MIKNQTTLYLIISVFFIQSSLPCFAMQDTEEMKLQKGITTKQELPFQDKDPSWICGLGVSLFKGENEQIKNYRQAAQCWYLASLRGHAKSQCFLGEAYRRGFGVPQDDIKAEEYFQMAADQGNEEAKEALNKYYSLPDEPVDPLMVTEDGFARDLGNLVENTKPYKDQSSMNPGDYYFSKGYDSGFKK